MLLSLYQSTICTHNLDIFLSQILLSCLMVYSDEQMMTFTSESCFFSGRPSKALYLHKVLNNPWFDSPVHDIRRSLLHKAIYGNKMSPLANTSQRKTKHAQNEKDLKATYFPDRRWEDLQWNLDLIQALETAQFGLLFLSLIQSKTFSLTLGKKPKQNI